MEPFVVFCKKFHVSKRPSRSGLTVFLLSTHQVSWAASWTCRWVLLFQGCRRDLWTTGTTGTGYDAATWSWSALTTIRCRPCPGGNSTWVEPNWRPPAGPLHCSQVLQWCVNIVFFFKLLQSFVFQEVGVFFFTSVSVSITQLERA